MKNAYRNWRSLSIYAVMACKFNGCFIKVIIFSLFSNYKVFKHVYHV